MSDAQFLKLRYWLKFSRWPDYGAPKDFNECTHEYMLRCRDPLLKQVADKYAMRRYIADTVGSEYLIPCMGVWDTADAVPLQDLPRPFVIKATVGNDMNLFYHPDTPLQEDRVRAVLRRWLATDYSRWNREWCYQDLPRRIMVEQLLQTPEGRIPPDLKFYVVGNRVRFIQFDRDRFGNHTRNLYDTDWNLLPVRLTKQNHDPDPEPECLREAVAVAEKLARPFEFLRVDIYNVNGRIFIGELTNYSGAGFEIFMPASFGHQLARWWKEKN